MAVATEKEIKAFRWKGPGVLHISRPDGKLKVIPPYTPGEIEHGCLVKDPVNVDALGQARIAALVAEGKAEVITWADNIAGFIRPDAKAAESTTLADAQASEVQLQEVHSMDVHAEKQMAKAAEKLSDSEKEKAAHDLRKMGPAGPVVTRGGDAPSFTPPSPDIPV